MKLRHSVFWPPFLMTFVALAFHTVDSKKFVSSMNGLNEAVLGVFSNAFAICGLFVVMVAGIAYLSPLGREKLGGQDAVPTFSVPAWAAITLCTNTGAGILFWAMAEPLYHFAAPANSLGLSGGTPEAARFAMSSLYLHWALTPAAIYGVPALAFAYAFFNRGTTFSTSSALVPLLGSRTCRRLSAPCDAIALYALVLGMAASLATGILTISGGLSYLIGVKSAPWLWIAVGVLLVLAFLFSSLSGVDRGIKHLSYLNSWFFLFLAGFVIVYGMSPEALSTGLLGLKDYLFHFLGRSLLSDYSATDPWPKSWTVFYWAVWLAWTPITAAFLGRLGYGHTVRRFMEVTVFLPAVFGVLWMMIFGGTTLGMELRGLGLGQVLTHAGPEAVAYAVFEKLPLASVIIPVFLFVVSLSYVTAADSSNVAMASLSTKGISPENPDPPVGLKLVWGVLVGALSLIMLVHSGIEGIKVLSYLGGLPALLLEFGAGISLLTLVAARVFKKREKRYERFSGAH